MKEIIVDELTPAEKQKFNDWNMNIVQRNEFIQNRTYTLESGKDTKPLSLIEQKIFLYAVSKIMPEDNIFKKQSFILQEFFDCCQMKIGGTSYDVVKESLRKLGTRGYWLNDGNSCKLVRLFDYVEIFESSKYSSSTKIVLQLDKKLKPYLLQLQQGFTQYALRNIILMSSKYSIRLYELLKSYQYWNSSITFEVDKLKEIIDCKVYKNDFYGFKERVIIPAVKEINKYTDIKIDDVEYIRKGRTIKFIKFIYTDLSNSDNEQDVSELGKRQFNYLLK